MSAMKECPVTPSDGIMRTVRYKLFPNEVRVYAVWGDVTDQAALAEIGQQLAIENNVERVTIKI